MNEKNTLIAQCPLILRAHRLMETFTKSDDEREFFLDRLEGFIIFVDLDKPTADLQLLEEEIGKNPDRYSLVPKLTFYEMKKIMEGFVNEKVYDIDTKEKLLDIIQSKEARENFLDFVYDHHSELEKWQQFYQERLRIRIIEWLRNANIHFVFEEDLEMSPLLLEKIKETLFDEKANKEIQAARKLIVAKAKSYYSTEALNPRPKRGRPPKQILKAEVEPLVSKDIYLSVPMALRSFLFIPDISTASDLTFSSKYESGDGLMANMRSSDQKKNHVDIYSLSKKLEDLRSLSASWIDQNDKEALSHPTTQQFQKTEQVEHTELNEEVTPSVERKAKKSESIKPKSDKKAGAKKINTSSEKVVKKASVKEKKKVEEKPTKKKVLLRRTKKTG